MFLHMAGIVNMVMLMKLLLNQNVLIIHIQSNESGTVHCTGKVKVLRSIMA